MGLDALVLNMHTLKQTSLEKLDIASHVHLKHATSTPISQPVKWDLLPMLANVLANMDSKGMDFHAPSAQIPTLVCVPLENTKVMYNI